MSEKCCQKCTRRIVNGNNICANLQLAMCVCKKAWCERTPERRRQVTRKTVRRTMEQEPTQKLRLEGSRCHHYRKEMPARRLQRKTQCVERRPVGPESEVFTVSKRNITERVGTRTRVG